MHAKKLRVIIKVSSVIDVIFIFKMVFMARFPIGLQNFQRIINEGFLYVDKTALIYKMITQGVAYFLSRPRRFGKSLLISTLEALFLGKKELFKELWIDSSDYSWKEYSVIRIDISKTVTSSPEALSTSLQEIVKTNAEKIWNYWN